MNVLQFQSLKHVLLPHTAQVQRGQQGLELQDLRGVCCVACMLMRGVVAELKLSFSPPKWFKPEKSTIEQPPQSGRLRVLIEKESAKTKNP